MKKLFLIASFNALFFSASAQRAMRMNFEPGVALPLQGGLKTGFVLTDQIILNPQQTKGQTLIVLNMSSFAPEDNKLVRRYTSLALRGGYRFLPSKSRVFIDGEAGIGALAADMQEGIKPKTKVSLGFSYSAGTGVFLKENQRLALALRYTGLAGKTYMDWISFGLAVSITRH